MTLKGQKNHYNIKFLRGYGASINLSDHKIVLKDGMDVFTGKTDIEKWFVTQIPYERIVLAGKGYVSTEAIGLLVENNINVILTDAYGNLVTNMSKVMVSDTATRYRMGQYDTFMNESKLLTMQQDSITAKLDSQIGFFDAIARDDATERIQPCISDLHRYKEEIPLQRNKRDLLRIEAGAGFQYFKTYTGLFDEKYGFLSRHGGGTRTGNRYASDVINALLNYGYSVLAAEIAKFVNGYGLDPYYGFMHKTHNSFQALVYDVIEPFRWLVECAVYNLAVQEPKHGRYISKVEYAWTREGRIILDTRLIRRFLELLERTFQNERPYEFKHGLKMKNGMSMCQEITIVKISVYNLANYCERDIHEAGRIEKC